MNTAKNINHTDKVTEQHRRIATILFVDLIGSSDVASIQESRDYNKYVSQFQNMTLSVFEEETKDGRMSGKRASSLTKDFVDFNVRGDEGFLVLAGKKNHERDLKHTIEKDIITSLRIALRLKYEWLFDQKNLDRMRKMKRPFEIAIGINTGRIDLIKDPNLSNEIERKYVAEGYAVNLAKRIEGQSRTGMSSGIFVSEYTFGKYNEIGGENTLRFIPQERSSLKGISGKVQLYELVFANLDDEDELMKIPKGWFSEKEWKRRQTGIRASLKKVEEEFSDTLNPWFGQVASNIKWRKAWNLLDDLNEDNKEAKGLLRESAKIARKLIEIRPNDSFWKIYLAQIIFDLIHEKLYKSDAEKKLLIKESVRMLETLSSSDPHDLDARVYYGKYFLEISETAYILDTEGMATENNLSLRQKEEIIEQFQLVLLWDEKYASAHYYLSVALLKSAVIKEGKIKKPLSSEITEAMRYLKMSIKYAGEINRKYKIRMIKDAKDDSNFDAVRHLDQFKNAVK